MRPLSISFKKTVVYSKSYRLIFKKVSKIIELF